MTTPTRRLDIELARALYPTVLDLFKAQETRLYADTQGRPLAERVQVYQRLAHCGALTEAMEILAFHTQPSSSDTESSPSTHPQTPGATSAESKS